MTTDVRATSNRWGIARRARAFILLTGALLLVFLANWIAVSVHIASLQHQATVELKSGGNPDDALERKADAADFQDARTAFELLTLVSAATLIGGTTYSIRRTRCLQS